MTARAHIAGAVAQCSVRDALPAALLQDGISRHSYYTLLETGHCWQPMLLRTASIGAAPVGAVPGPLPELCWVLVACKGPHRAGGTPHQAAKCLHGTHACMYPCPRGGNRILCRTWPSSWMLHCASRAVRSSTAGDRPCWNASSTLFFHPFCQYGLAVHGRTHTSMLTFALASSNIPVLRQLMHRCRSGVWASSPPTCRVMLSRSCMQRCPVEGMSRTASLPT